MPPSDRFCTPGYSCPVVWFRCAGYSMERIVRMPAGFLMARGVLWALISFSIGTGCADHRRPCVPGGLLDSETTIDLNSATEVDFAREREALTMALARLKATPPGEA